MTYPDHLAHKIIDQIYFKMILEYCEVKKPEFDKITETKDNKKFQLIQKKQYSKVLLSIDSGRLVLYEVAKKDDVDIASCEVINEDKVGIA